MSLGPGQRYLEVAPLTSCLTIACCSMGKRKTSPKRSDDKPGPKSAKSGTSSLSTDSTSSSSSSSCQGQAAGVRDQGDVADTTVNDVADQPPATGKRRAKAKATCRQRRATSEGNADGNADSDDDCGDADASQSIHNKIRKLAEAENWPDGPTTVEDLFNWAEYNCQRLMKCDSLDMETRKLQLARVIQLLQMDMEVHEAYGGTGNGASTLHRQVVALRRTCEEMAFECTLFAFVYLLCSFHISICGAIATDQRIIFFKER